MSAKINVALVGLGFGGAFVPIYRHHPDVGKVGVFDPDISLSGFFMERYGCDKVYSSFEEILEDKSVDAVHLISPIPFHEEQTLKVLESGKHCACTVPMAITLEGLKKIIENSSCEALTIRIWSIGQAIGWVFLPCIMGPMPLLPWSWRQIPGLQGHIALVPV